MTTPPLEMIWPHYPAPEGHSCDAMGCASAGPHNIEPELKAMTTPTPRTDALHTIACIASALITGPSEYSRAELKGFANELSSAHLQLERDLAARDAELAEVKEALREQTINANSGRVERELWAAKCDELDAMKQRAEAAEMRLKLYEPIHTFNGLTIEEWKRKAEAAERDAFTMAAGQCIVKSGGLMADDHGHQYCDMERQRDEWKRKAEEAARDADAAAIYGNTGRAHGFVGIPKWSELAEETRNLYREALAARAAIAAKGEA